MVFGDGCKFVLVFIVLSFDGLWEWVVEEGIDFLDDLKVVCCDDWVYECIEIEVDVVNENFEFYE